MLECGPICEHCFGTSPLILRNQQTNLVIIYMYSNNYPGCLYQKLFYESPVIRYGYISHQKTYNSNKKNYSILSLRALRVINLVSVK